MARLRVTIDSRGAVAGAREFTGAQDQIRTSARRTLEEIERANAKTVAATLEGLDREIERRRAVQRAQQTSVEEGRIEAKAQDVINGLRAKGITLTEQEIAQIREKTRASQELANAIESTIRAARTQDQANAIANAQRSRAYEAGTAGPQFGPMTEAQHLEEANRQSEALSRTFGELRGWIGDVGDMFDYVGQNILGYNEAQSQAISTTIQATEKGMALGEVFGPQGAAVGALAGAFLGLVSAEIEANNAFIALQKSTNEYFGLIVQKTQIEAAQRNLEILYTGSAKVTNQLSALSKVNISDVDKKMAEFAKTIEDTQSDAIFGQGLDIAAQAQKDLAQVFVNATNDKIDAIARMGAATQELSNQQHAAQAEETQSATSALGRWNEAEDAVKSAQKAVQDYAADSAKIAAGLQKERDEAAAAYANDPSEENYKRLNEIKDKSAILAQERSKIGDVLLQNEARAIARATSLQEKYNSIVAKAPGFIRGWAGELAKAAEQADKDLAGGSIGYLVRNLSSNSFLETFKQQQSKNKAAQEAAKNAAKTRADALQDQREDLAAQQAIWDAYQKGGEQAAKVEEKFQSLTSGKGFSAKQLAEARANAEQLVFAEQRLADAKKASAEADKEAAEAAKKAQEEAAKVAQNKTEFLADVARETEERQQLAGAIALGSREYDYQTRLIAALNRVREGGFVLTEQELSDLKARIRAQQDYDDIISKGQTGNKEQAKQEKQKSPIEALIEQYDAATTAAQNFESIAVNGINTFSSAFAGAMFGTKIEWGSLMRSMAIELTELLIKMTIAAALKGVLSGATGGAGASLSGLIMGGAPMLGAAFHDGGTVGAGGSPRMVSPSWFVGAPRFHGGLQLRPDEYPAILQTGEEVLSRQQVAQRQRGGRSEIHFHLPNVTDGRGFARTTDQHAQRMRRILEVDRD